MIYQFPSPKTLVISNRTVTLHRQVYARVSSDFPRKNVLLPVVVAIDNDKSDQRNATVLPWV